MKKERIRQEKLGKNSGRLKIFVLGLSVIDMSKTKNKQKSQRNWMKKGAQIITANSLIFHIGVLDYAAKHLAPGRKKLQRDKIRRRHLPTGTQCEGVTNYLE